MSSDDRVFLHLLVGADKFGDTKTPDLIFYVKESRCHLETVRLIQKFDSRGMITKERVFDGWTKEHSVWLRGVPC